MIKLSSNHDKMVAHVKQIIQQHHWRAHWSVDVDDMCEDIVTHITNMDFSVWLIAALIEEDTITHES